MTAAGLAAVAVLLLAVSLARVAPATLRLQEGRWTLAQHPASGDGIEVDEVNVAIDLGSFMLLSMRAVVEPGRQGVRRWLPAQRQGHEQDWHALRCAAYSPRPAPPGPDAAATAPHG